MDVGHFTPPHGDYSHVPLGAALSAAHRCRRRYVTTGMGVFSKATSVLSFALSVDNEAIFHSSCDPAKSHAMVKDRSGQDFVSSANRAKCHHAVT
jgi:hypothetical protein